MADLLSQLEAFVREQRGAARDEEEQAWRQRVDERLERLAAAKPEKSRRELLEELAADDSLLAELERELASEVDDDELEPAAADDDESDGDEGDDDDDDGEQPEGIRWQRVPFDVPRIYSGDDEPEHVEYLDEEGKTQVRPGCRRGQPVAEDWVELEPDDDDGDEADEEGDDE